MSYMVEGGGSTTYSKSKCWLYCYAEESKRLLQRITDVVVRYLVLQVAAGAQVLLSAVNNFYNMNCIAYIVKVIFVIAVIFLFLLCVSTILVNKYDQKNP